MEELMKILEYIFENPGIDEKESRRKFGDISINSFLEIAVNVPHPGQVIHKSH